MNNNSNFNNNNINNNTTSAFARAKVTNLGGWHVKETIPFTKDDIAAIDSAIVIENIYGEGVRFTMKSGDIYIINLSRDMQALPGYKLTEEDMSSIRLITLSKTGREDITRIEW